MRGGGPGGPGGPSSQHTRTVFALDPLLSLSELQEQRRRRRPARYGGNGDDSSSDEDGPGNRLDDTAARAAGALMSAFARKGTGRRGAHGHGHGHGADGHHGLRPRTAPGGGGGGGSHGAHDRRQVP